MTFARSSVALERQLDARLGQFVNTIADTDIHLLRTFCVVVSNGGLSAATTELQADLSAVSRQVKELEDKVGVRLCNRGRSGFSLTQHGEVVHRAALELLLALKTFRENIQTLHADPVGDLRLGVMDALLTDPQFHLADALHRYRKKAPRVHIHISVSKPSDIERQLLSGELDAGIVAARERPSGLLYQQLYLEPSSLYCSSRHPLYMLPDCDLQLPQADTLALIEDPYTESLPLSGRAALFRKAASADSIEAVALLIGSGDYVGFLPDHYAAAIAPTMRLRRLRPDLFSYQQGIELAWRAGAFNCFARALFAELGVRVPEIPLTG